MALTKAEMAEHLFEELGLNKREAKDMVEMFFEEIRMSLENGRQVKLSGFGNFDLREKKQRPGRNVTTRRAEIGISSPVLGLRPGRWFLSRRSKLPKPDSLTCSLFSRQTRISSKKSSTISLASRLFSPSSSKRRSAISDLVRAPMRGRPSYVTLRYIFLAANQ